VIVLMRRSIAIVLLMLSFNISGCLGEKEDSEGLILATTTSMRDSGLLDVLLSSFKEEYGIEIGVVAVGTGAALKLGENQDADILIVHAPEKEIQFIEQGYGNSRTTFAWNRFVLLGPSELNEPTNVSEAFEQIQNECIISRGDGSGTHIKEQEIWRSTTISLIEDSSGTHPSSESYYSIGQGMGAALNMANELRCWVLSDMGTWLSMSPQLDLVANIWEDELTLNQYSIIQLDNEYQSQTLLFEEYLMSTKGETIIAEYTINDQQMFNPGQPNQEPSSNA
tara:strand:- start:420 stop:1262 length:843 start_codon:yes stop_codon:yes gene_type:complete